MIDFKNPGKLKRRVTKHTVIEGDFYLRSLSSQEKEDMYSDKKANANNEDFIVDVIASVLCDEEGVLVDLSKEDLKLLQDTLFADIVSEVSFKVLGKKKA